MKRQAPATERNREPIAAVLKDIVPARGLVLEIASGTGEHAVYLAGLFPGLTWQPTDPDPEALTSIAAWTSEFALPNVRTPLPLDAAADDWPVDRADARLCINMVHISPWTATEGLMRGAGRLLAPGAPLILYGPYLQADVPTAPSNLDFDAWLKARDPAFGLRSVENVAAEAEKNGLSLERIVPMPANNLILRFRKA